MGSYTSTYALSDGSTAYGSQVRFELDSLGSSVNNIATAQILNDAITFAKISDSGDFGPFAGDWQFNQIALPVVSAPSTSGDEVKLYSKDISSRAWPHFREESDGAEIALGRIVQVVNTQSGAVAQSSGTAVYDDNIPTLTQCPVISAFNTTITPTNTNNKLKIDVVLMLSVDTSAAVSIISLFQDAGTSSLASMAWIPDFAASDIPLPVMFTHYMAAGGTSATTFKVGIGGVGGATVTVNGEDNARKLGGVAASSITITEIAA